MEQHHPMSATTRRRALATAGLAMFGASFASSSKPAENGPSASDSRLNVPDFGAKGDGVADDTAAIQSALDAAKGADGTAAGRSVFSLHFPSVPGGFYKVTDTLVIDGTHGAPSMIKWVLEQIPLI